MLPLFPVLMLLTAFGSFFLYKHTKNELFAILAVGNALICSIWGLLMAHWSILAICLLVTLKLEPILLASNILKNRN
jgi:hypothetical protein